MAPYAKCNSSNLIEQRNCQFAPLCCTEASKDAKSDPGSLAERAKDGSRKCTDEEKYDQSVCAERSVDVWLPDPVVTADRDEPAVVGLTASFR